MHEAVERTAGELVDRFSILHPLGSGGLGDVLAAYDPELDRRIALKFLRAPKRQGTARLLREAQAMARLRHPNVITVYDVGVDAGEVFIAMELVEGQTLATWLHERARPWTEVRDAMVEAGRGLAASHAAGLVHRDFKPANVMVEEGGRVVVLDFGLARRHRDEHEGAPERPRPAADAHLRLDGALTDDGVVLGTLPYMAPELFTSTAGTPASDQFAFCVALYEGLYGERPFRADTDEAHVAMVEAGAPKAPRDSRVPRWLHAAVVRGLSPDPSERFGSMDALLLAVVHDRRRRRRGALVGVFVTVLAAGLGAAATAILQPAPTAEALAAIDGLEAEARDAAARGHYLHPPVDAPDEPTALGRILVLEHVEGPAAEASHEAATRLRSELAAALVELGQIYDTRAGGEAFAADFYAAALVFDPAHERARAHTVVTPGQLAVLQRAAESGEFSRAELLAAEPLAVLADAEPERRREKIAALYARKRGISTMTRERLRELLDVEESQVADWAEREPPRVAAAPEHDGPSLEPTELAPADDPSSASTGSAAAHDEDPSTTTETDAGSRESGGDLTRAGRSALARGDLGEAEARFHRALRLDRHDPAALEGLADVYFQRGKYALAADFAGRAVRRTPRKAALHVKLGDAYFKVLRYDDAEKAYRAARKLGSEVAAARLAMVAARLGDHAEP